MNSEIETEKLAARLIAAGYWVSLDYRVTEMTAAEIIGVSTRLLRLWRTRGTGPTFVRAGRVTYRLTEILAFITSREYQRQKVA